MLTGTERRRTIRNIVVFAVIVLAIGWIGRALDLLLEAQDPETPGMALWITAPVTVSVLLRAFAGDGWRDLGLAPRLRGNFRWYVVAVLVFPVLVLAVLLPGAALGFLSIPDRSLGAVTRFLQGATITLLPLFLKNILEEFAWRGYLTPKVHALGGHDLVGHGIVGLIWGLWHLPYFLFFLDRADLESYTALGLTTFIVLALFAMLSWAVVFGEIRLLTGSIWPLVLMHMVEDALLNPLLIEGYVVVDSEWEWLASPAVGLMSIGLFATVGIALHHFRTRGSGVSPALP